MKQSGQITGTIILFVVAVKIQEKGWRRRTYKTMEMCHILSNYSCFPWPHVGKVEKRCRGVICDPSLGEIPLLVMWTHSQLGFAMKRDSSSQTSQPQRSFPRLTVLFSVFVPVVSPTLDSSSSYDTKNYDHPSRSEAFKRSPGVWVLLSTLQKNLFSLPSSTSNTLSKWLLLSLTSNWRNPPMLRRTGCAYYHGVNPPLSLLNCAVPNTAKYFFTVA